MSVLDKWMNTVQCMDCLEGMKQLPDGCVDEVVTDPEWKIFNPVVLDEIKRVLKDGSALFLWFSQYKIGYIQSEIEQRFNLKNIIVEHKKNMVVTTWDKDKLQIQWEPIFFAIKGEKATINVTERKFKIGLAGDVWVTTVPQSNFSGDKCKVHPWQKSVNSCKKAIALQSNEGDIVLDPFLGGGTTALACKQLGRRFIGFEINPKYVDICNQRLAQEILL